MPNTLAHLGIQALLTRRLIAQADLGWIFLGCVLPDLPWILQRVVTALPVSLSSIDLRLYVVVQSTLLFCLVLAATFACLTLRPLRVFAILSLGCLLHLLLDATQTKWANGVLLVAPLDWRLVNFGLYWPENWSSHALSLLGLSYVAWAAWQIGPGALRLWRPPARRMVAAAVLLGLYVLGPLVLMPAAEAADVHYVGTLRDVLTRPGRVVEFDRADIRRAADGSAQLGVWTGETLALTGQPVPASAERASVRGRFVDALTVEVTEMHLHPVRRRDIFTILGLLLVTIWWGVMLLAGLRRA